MRRFFGDWVDDQSMEVLWSAAGKDKGKLAFWIDQLSVQIELLESIQTRSTKVLEALGRAHERLVARSRARKTHVRIQGEFLKPNTTSYQIGRTVSIQDGFGIIRRRQNRTMDRVCCLRRRKDMLYEFRDELKQIEAER